MIDGGRGAPLPIQRTFLTARSVEFDALLIAGGPIPTDSRVPLMLTEAFRHAKAIGGWGDATDALSAAGCSTDAPSVVLADSPTDALSQLTDLLGTHRVWERFAPAVAAADDKPG
jgi:catalase